MGTKRTAEFRQEAVRVALTSGLTRKQVTKHRTMVIREFSSQGKTAFMVAP